MKKHMFRVVSGNIASQSMYNCKSPCIFLVFFSHFQLFLQDNMYVLMCHFYILEMYNMPYTFPICYIYANFISWVIQPIHFVSNNARM
jgi:hypothetical protein